MTIITTLLIILAALVAIILLLLSFSFHISLKLFKDGGIVKGLVEIRWFKIKLFTRKFPEEKEEIDEKKDKEQKTDLAAEKEKSKEEKFSKSSKLSKFKWEDIKKILSLFGESLPHFLKFFKSLWVSINLEKFNFYLIFGLSSPVDTAKILGCFWAAAAVINLSPKADIFAEPSFLEEKIDFESDISFQVRLLGPFLALLRLLTRISVIKLLWEFRRFR
ncbi:MAG: hypothetical protein Q7U35_12290 [Methanobacteriaceae archaeon]|nr:hypothetical protein [Methanobacteriaceae archaeon]MDP2836663.1 hypothetical protein [Methanobacteriaceae archaeon]MDP3036029.1 hypothetical protein [Methanobacteriaceae archaeon]MDP3485319.1 hypothetical protein [Methanobacteriaceae archaeon]MDP3624186.1 hypothetical protein [Methanobacteriaceae archaeon]